MKKDFREDFRETLTFTIDPQGAKDYDDAISFKVLKDDLFEVGIHIADVSHFVAPNSKIDKEAYEKGTSTYLTDKVIPMLPEELCNDLCSLQPNEDRLCFSVVCQINDKAEVEEHRIVKTTIHSDFRFTYEQVQEVLDSQDITRAKGINHALLQLNVITQIFRQRRLQAGALDIEREEVRFVLDEEGNPATIFVEEASASHQLIEELMLLANRIVATTIQNKKERNKPVPFVYRVHDKPPMDKQERLAHIAKGFGFDYQPSNKKETTVQRLNKLLADSKDTIHREIIQLQVIRTMAKAEYSTKNIGHYGLLFQNYTHFTSPIRRYPDLMVHRLLAWYLFHDDNRNAPPSQAQLEKRCVHCSQCEQNAMEQERFSIKLAFAKFISQHYGEDFEAVIISVTEFGIFVQLLENRCEGLISMRHLAAKRHLRYDERRAQLIDIYTGEVAYRLGEKITVTLKRADTRAGYIDFVLAKENKKTPASPERKKAKKNRQNK